MTIRNRLQGKSAGKGGKRESGGWVKNNEQTERGWTFGGRQRRQWKNKPVGVQINGTKGNAFDQNGRMQTETRPVTNKVRIRRVLGFLWYLMTTAGARLYSELGTRGLDAGGIDWEVICAGMSLFMTKLRKPEPLDGCYLFDSTAAPVTVESSAAEEWHIAKPMVSISNRTARGEGEDGSDGLMA